MSDLRLPRYGLGTAGIGNLYAAVSDDVAHATVAAAWRAGIRYYDSAPHYGFGLAERRLGEALAVLDRGREAIVSTKVGRLLVPATEGARERHGFVDADPYEPVFDYRGDAVRRSLDESLSRLGRDRIDLLLAHDLGMRTHGAAHERHMRDFLDSGYPAMQALKQAGLVGAIGIGVNEVQVCEFLLRRVELDAILLAGRYTLLDQSAAARLLPLCRTRGTRVIIGGPYNSGILAQPVRAQGEARYDYHTAPDAILARAAEIESICAEYDVALGTAALQFPLRHPAVDCVIAGPVGAEQMHAMVARIEARVPQALWSTLQEKGYIMAGDTAGSAAACQG